MDPVEEFLSHHGIKGMHWGNHNKSQKRKLTKSQRRVRNVRRVNKVNQVIGGVSLGLFGIVKTAQLANHVDANPERYIKVGKFVNKMGRTPVKLAIKLAKGSSLLFKKDTVIFSPGNFVPGMFRDAGPLAITRVASDIGRF